MGPLALSNGPMVKGDPITSPQLYDSADYHDRWIHCVMNFNVNSGVLQSVVVSRDVDCVYTRIAFGVGPDGTMETSDKILEVPAGAATFYGVAELAQILGGNTIALLRGGQITALPPAS